MSGSSVVAELERLEAAMAAPAPGAPLHAGGPPLLTRGLLRRRRSWGGDEADVLVRPGDRVDAGDAIARLRRPARATALDGAAVLGVSPDRVEAILTPHPGDTVAEGDVLAERRALAGFQRRTLRSPISGRLSYVSPAYGTVYIESLPAESPVLAHLSGTVTAVDRRGVSIEGYGLAVAGVTGAGPAATGPLLLAEEPGALPADAGGAVVACAFPLLEATVQALADAGAAAVLAPGITDSTLERLGWDDLLWSAPVRLDGAQRGGTRPAPPLTCVLLSVSPREVSPAVWSALRPLSGKLASAAGSEPGLAPELLIALEPEGTTDTVPAVPPLISGARVRIVAGRAAGLGGEVVATSETPYRMSSEVLTEVVAVRVEDGTVLRLPLSHLQSEG